MSKPSYVQPTVPGLKPESVAQRRLPRYPPSLNDDNIAMQASSCLKQLFDRFKLIDKHEAEVGRLQHHDATYRLSESTRRSMANRIRRQIGPTTILAASLLTEKAYKADPKDKINIQFIVGYQTIIKAIQKDDAVRDLLRPYTLDDASENAIRLTTKVPTLPELKAALATNLAGWDYKVYRGHDKNKQKETKNDLELASVQWKVVELFLCWKEQVGRNDFALVDIQRVKERLDQISMYLEYVREAIGVEEIRQ